MPVSRSLLQVNFVRAITNVFFQGLPMWRSFAGLSRGAVALDYFVLRHGREPPRGSLAGLCNGVSAYTHREGDRLGRVFTAESAVTASTAAQARTASIRSAPSGPFDLP